LDGKNIKINIINKLSIRLNIKDNAYNYGGPWTTFFDYELTTDISNNGNWYDFIVSNDNNEI